MIAMIAEWARAYPIVSVEDGLAEEDWSYWPALCSALAPHAITLGDDLLCTNPARIARAIETRACGSFEERCAWMRARQAAKALHALKAKTEPNADRGIKSRVAHS
jgi:hypothetical protein